MFFVNQDVLINSGRNSPTQQKWKHSFFIGERWKMN